MLGGINDRQPGRVRPMVDMPVHRRNSQIKIMEIDPAVSRSDLSHPRPPVHRPVLSIGSIGSTEEGTLVEGLPIPSARDPLSTGSPGTRTGGRGRSK